MTLQDPVKFCPGCRQACSSMKEILQKWARNRARPDGLDTYCKACKSLQDHRRYLARKEWAGVEALRKWMAEGLDEIQDPVGDGVSLLFPTNR